MLRASLPSLGIEGLVALGSPLLLNKTRPGSALMDALMCFWEPAPGRGLPELISIGFLVGAFIKVRSANEISSDILGTSGWSEGRVSH